MSHTMKPLLPQLSLRILIHPFTFHQLSKPKEQGHFTDLFQAISGLVPTLQFSMAQRYLNGTQKSKGRDQKLPVALFSLSCCSAPLMLAQVLWAAPTHYCTPTIPCRWGSGSPARLCTTVGYPNAATAVTFISSKPGSQEK